MVTYILVLAIIFCGIRVLSRFQEITKKTPGLHEVGITSSRYFINKEAFVKIPTPLTEISRTLKFKTGNIST